MLQKSIFRLGCIIALAILGLTTSAQAQCPFTYEQGLNTGCKLAQLANENGCYSIRCFAPASNTVDRYMLTCTEYAMGVIAGFHQCNSPGGSTNDSPTTGGGNGSTNNGGDEPDCYFINGELVCE